MSEIPPDVSVIRVDDVYRSSETIEQNRLIEIQYFQAGLVSDNDLYDKYLEYVKVNNAGNRNAFFCPDHYILWALDALRTIDQVVDMKRINIVYCSAGPNSDQFICGACKGILKKEE